MALLGFDARDAFDAVYGASAGAMNASYFLTGARRRPPAAVAAAWQPGPRRGARRPAPARFRRGLPSKGAVPPCAVAAPSPQPSPPCTPQQARPRAWIFTRSTSPPLTRFCRSSATGWAARRRPWTWSTCSMTSWARSRPSTSTASSTGGSHWGYRAAGRRGAGTRGRVFLGACLMASSAHDAPRPTPSLAPPPNCSPVPLKVVASSLDTLRAEILHDFESVDDLKMSLKCSAAVPNFAGPPRAHRGHRCARGARAGREPRGRARAGRGRGRGPPAGRAGGGAGGRQRWGSVTWEPRPAGAGAGAGLGAPPRAPSAFD